MTTRKYQSRSQQTTLSSGLSAVATTMIVGSGVALIVSAVPAGQTFTVVIDPDTALEEIVDVSDWASGNTLTITRAIDGSTGVAHSAGAVVRHMVTGRDLREANAHIESTTTAHGVTFSNLIQTTDTNVVSSAMITNLTIVDGDISASAAIANSKLATNPLARANHTGTQLAATVSDFDTQVRTSRLDQMATPTAAVAMGAQQITGLADPTLAQDAATKAYVGAQITALVGGAPGTLDTLGEIATAINSSGTFATSVVLRDGTQAMTGALAMGTNKITGLGTPTVNTDAVTKLYVDSILSPPSGNLTGPITSTGVVTAVASQTGTGSTFVMSAGSPTLTTPKIDVITTATGAATAATLWSDVTTGSITVGAGLTTGTFSLDASSTGAHIVNLGTGITASGSTKTLNLGTAGASGSTTNINIGSATSGALGTTTLNDEVVLANGGNVGNLKDFHALQIMGCI